MNVERLAMRRLAYQSLGKVVIGVLEDVVMDVVFGFDTHAEFLDKYFFSREMRVH